MSLPPHTALGGLQIPDGLVVRSCTRHPGVLGLIPKQEEPGETDAPCVKVQGSSRAPVDHKVANAPLKKGTRDTCKAWNQQDRGWVDISLHESHEESSVRVTHTTVSRHAAS